MDERFEQAPLGVIETDLDGRVLNTDPTARDILARDAETLHQSDLTETFPESAAAPLRDAFAGDVPDTETFEEYYPGIDRWLRLHLARVGDGVILYLQDVSQRRGDDRTIDRLRRRLDRLEQLDTLVSTVLHDLIGASDKQEVARTICERLGGTDLYAFTWVGERDRATDQIRVTAAAGDAPDLREYLETGPLEAPLPERQALESASTTVIETIPDDESLPRALRVAAFGQGLQSAVAVPLVYAGTVYGVLGVYSSHAEGFSTQERTGLETLGAVAGFAINAIRQEDLLFADSVTELQLELHDERLPLLDVAADHDTRLSLVGAVPREDETTVYYIRSGLAPARLVDALRGRDAVHDVRRVQTEDGATDADSQVEVRVAGQTPVATLLAWGATIQRAEYADRTVSLHVDLPPGSDVRSALDQLDARFDRVDLRKKREQTREPETVQTFRNEVTDRLTDREREVLRIAYLGDYFESPRGSTSEDLARALDITGPTVLYHLRKAQRKLLETFFEGQEERTPRE